MSMKKFFSFLFLLTVCLNFAIADDYNLNNGSSSASLKKEHNPERPNAPARYAIECEYSAGNLLFNLPPFVAWGYVEILDGTSTVFDGMVYAEKPLLSIPELHGIHTIRFTTDSGAVYSGSIML